MKTSILFAAFLMLGLCAQAQADWNSVVSASNPLASVSAAVDYGSAHSNGTYGSGAFDAARNVQGVVEKAAQFGNQGTVLLNEADLTGVWSPEFVVERTGTKRASMLIRGLPLTFPTIGLDLEQFQSTGQFGFVQYGVENYLFTPNVPSPIDQWRHIVYVNRAGSGFSLNLNGVFAGSNALNISLSRYQIGSNTGTIPESPLTIMDEAILHNRALSPAEIAALAAAVPDPSWHSERLR